MIQTNAAVSTAAFFPCPSEVYKQNNLMLTASWGFRTQAVNYRGNKPLGFKKDIIIIQATFEGGIAKVG